MLFSGLLLGLLWLFQIVFLDSFYKSIKTRTLKSSGDMVVRNIESQGLAELVDQIAIQNNVSIRIVDSQGNELLKESTESYNRFIDLPAWQLQDFYNRAQQNGGILFEQFSKESFDFTNKDGEFPLYIGKVPGKAEFMMESMIYVRTLEKSDGTSVMVLLHSQISPVNSTVETLRVQFVYIAVIMLVLSLLLALGISRLISAPIVQINRTNRHRLSMAQIL